MYQDAQQAATPRRIHESLQRWAASHPGAPALADAAIGLSYAELAAAVEAVAGRFTEAGVRPGDRLLLVGENSVALAVCILAASRIDAWSATVNARLSAREIDNFLQHSGARRALYFGAASPAAQAHGEARGAQPVALPGIGEVLLGPLNETAEPEPVQEDGARQVAALVYTSGTTGAPKAVMLTHANILFVAGNSARLRKLAPGDKVYAVLPLSHVYGLSSVLVASLLGGAAVQLAARFQVPDLVRALAEGVSILHGAPAMYAKLIEYGETQGNRIAAPRLRLAQSGGAPLTLPLKQGFERLFGIPLQNGYGMTEASPSICQTRGDSPRSDCSVGLPVPGIEIRLHEAEKDPDGVGELWVRGPNVMLGYYRDPVQTAQAVTEDGWLRTGDLARIEADGAVHIVGRSKELIIRSGFNVYPVEVEQVLNAYPEVVQSAVVGRPVEGNEEVVAFVEPAQGAAIDLDALRAYLRDNLSPYKQPSEIIILDQLPAAATGKVMKMELRRRAAAARQS
ncbi:Acyl-CoA synthetase (AMP-forming)/AMP-acid ligase II [Noviherbaspirillum humi]|uniref:Acyl-CoA synthetase (AMP-forming)/AMP-acid ligase II n=1 Tax=Noviherbaspirillum humi TaxID=1688639 RepID=A0A239E8T8_9BURK|nr:AMP-binding protein [Noviherbaspirillum humi]SNS40294.1 Acyl-CoA synthetase (AMP-forming)/AMP-acid ligase II [Noviherbaspirillum humi]